MTTMIQSLERGNDINIYFFYRGLKSIGVVPSIGRCGQHPTFSLQISMNHCKYIYVY